MNVGGNVSLDGALGIVAGAGLAPGNSFTILTTSGTSAGSFAGLPEGSLFAASGTNWIISYAGGTGNDVVLTVAGALDVWRWNNFGSTANTGAAGDTADPDCDGETNIIEFATGQSPNAGTRVPGMLVKKAANLEFTYTRSRAAVAGGLTFTVAWSDTLAPGTWSTAGIADQNPAPIYQDSNVETLKVLVPIGNSKRFVRLEITKP